MKKPKHFYRKFTVKKILQTQLVLLLILLSVLRSAGQEHLTGPAGADLSRETLLINQYMDAAKKGIISPDSAHKILSKALVLAKKNELKKETGLIWYLMGNKMLDKGNAIQCRRYLDSAFALNEQLKDGELTCVLNTLAARIYQGSSNYGKAASHYFRAIQAVEENEIDNPRPVAVLYYNLGGLMVILNEDSLANSYLLLSKQYLLKMQPVDSSFLVYILITQAWTQMKLDSNAAIGYYKNAYAMSGKLNNVLLSYTILINLAQCYIAQEQIDSAEHYLQLARPLARPGVSLVKTESVAGFVALKKKDYTASIMHLQKALDATNGEGGEHQEEIFEAFSEVYAARGEYSKAYEFHKKYMDQHKLRKDGRNKIVADFMLSLQGLEHEKTILQKKAEISSREVAIKKQRFWIVAMCLISVLLCVILIMAYRNYRNKKSLLSKQMRVLLQEQEIERLKAEAEGADNERSRIAYDIHDGVLVRLANVKMNLTGLHGLARDSHYQDIVGQLDMATRELRNTAHNLMPEILLEEGLEQAIFYFCKATEQASGLNVRFQLIGIPIPRLQPLVQISIYRIIQGLIQNVIQHAKASDCLVQLQYADYLCSITVEDNGEGIDNISQEEGYGFKSIRNRVKILLGTFDIDSTKGQGTTVYLEFDVRPFILH